MYCRPARRRRASILLPLVVTSACSAGAAHQGPMSTRDFVFVSSGRTLSGLVDQPSRGRTRALGVFVHGSGMTNVREENRYADLRRRFAELGIASVVWDKPGQGRSEGAFDGNQPLESSAQEVLDAIAALRAGKVPGFGRIGVWSTSSGSWVAPIAMFRAPHIEFWISVSGVPAEDNKHYRMETNLRLEGVPPWKPGN